MYIFLWLRVQAMYPAIVFCESVENSQIAVVLA